MIKENFEKEKTNSQESYGSESIKVLKGLDAVKKRPGMYIGDTDDGSGLHQMIYEVIDNAIDEFLAGHCNSVELSLNSEGSITVEDDGRGIPVDMHEEGVSAAEVIMTHLHSGGKFDHNSYKISGGLHGVGVSVVNALSDWLELRIYRNNKEYYMKFIEGNKEQSLQIIRSDVEKRGTKVSFLPSKKIFKSIDFNTHIIETRLRELAFLNSNLKITFLNNKKSEAEVVEFEYNEGMKSYIEYISRAKNNIHPAIVFKKKEEENHFEIEYALQWNEGYNENITCFTNNVKQKDGGTHLSALKIALTKTFSNYINENLGSTGKKNKLSIIGDDVREGLNGILSLKFPNPKFASQTKDKLISSEIKHFVETSISYTVSMWLEENPVHAKALMNKVLESASAREASKRAKDLLRKKNMLDISNLPGKLADCQEKDPKNIELFIVEGDSAGGTAKQGRNRKNQAILPLRGKILNVEKSRFDKIINSDQIGTLITALGTNIGKEDFDIEKLRYHKIIIMTDADVDGSHIRTLLLTFFYRHMLKIIDDGYLYIAQPPLYKLTRGKKEKYIKNEQDLEKYFLQKSNLEALNTKFINNNSEITRENFNKIILYLSQIRNILKKQPIAVNSAMLQMLLFNNLLSEKLYDENSYKEIEEKIITLNKKEKFKPENAWNFSIQEDKVEFFRTVRGKKYQEIFHKKNLNLPEIKDLLTLKNSIDQFLPNAWDTTKYHLMIDSKNYNIVFPLDILNLIFLNVRSLFTLQRFKGLGEMNSEQLWETTLNPEKRTLLKIKIQDLQESEEMISMLMGNVVEPRKDFIQSNASNVANLDI